MQKKFNINIQSVACYLIYFLPISLIIGAFAADLSIIIIDIIFLILIIKRNEVRKIFNNYFLFFFLIFYFIILISSIDSNNILYSLKTSMPYIRHIIFIFAIVYFTNVNKNFYKEFFFFLRLTFYLMLFDGFFQYFLGYNLLGLHHPHPARITSFFYDELKMGSYLSKMLPILIGLIMLFNKNKSSIYETIIIILLAEMLTYISKERSAFFAISLSAIYLTILLNNWKIVRLFTLIVTFILIGMLSYKDDSLFQRMINQPFKSFTKTYNQKIILTEYHDSLYKTSWNMFKQNPILGIGPKMYRKDCNLKKYKIDQNSCNSHPHNNYLQILAETGLLGFLVFSLFVIYFIFISIKQFISLYFKKKLFLTNFQICILSGILLIIWPLYPSGNFFNNWISIVYSLLIGIYLSTIIKFKL
jgi:O-antigen ligase